MGLNDQSARRYVRPPRPLHFPTESLMPETKWHLEQRTALYQVLKLAAGDRAALGSDQVVYWDPTDPTASVVPTLFLRTGQRDDLFDSWKVWERGAPHVVLDIAGGSDVSERAWAEKLRKYHRIGVLEVVRFDPDDTPLLRVWDYVAGDLVERDLPDQRGAECGPLGFWWVIVEDLEQGPVLRLAGGDGVVLPTPGELAVSEARGRARAEAERDAALERVRELEAKLKNRK